MQVSGSRQWGRWVSLAALTVIYILGGKLGLLFASVHASATHGAAGVQSSLSPIRIRSGATAR